MRDQSSQCVLWSTICWRTSQSKISAPPPVSDSRPASISSSRIASADSPEISSKKWISVAVNALSATSRQRRLQLAQHLRVVLPRQRRVQAVDDVQLGEPLVLHREGLLDRLADAHRVRVLLAGLALEAAVGAGRRADVGQVQVPVDVEEDGVAVLLGAQAVGETAQPGQVVGRVEVLTVLPGEALARCDLLRQFRRAGRAQRHAASVRGCPTAPFRGRGRGRAPDRVHTGGKVARQFGLTALTYRC